MKKILLVCAIMVAVLSFTGCGVTSHVSQNRTETQVVLSENNFIVVGQAYGESSVPMCSV